MAALQVRRAGVLLHPTSLPGDSYTGDFGQQARRFIDQLADAGLSIWQMLPIGPTLDDGCPYQSSSVHAGNPDLISMEWLVDHGLLNDSQAEQGKRGPDAKRREIGRASCRERVEISVVAGALKKKKKKRTHRCTTTRSSVHR